MALPLSLGLLLLALMASLWHRQTAATVKERMNIMRYGYDIVSAEML